MKVTNVKIRIIDNKPHLRAIASIIIDDSIAINDIKVIKTHRLFIAFPENSSASKPYNQIIAPLNSTTRKALESAILSRYHYEMFRYNEKSGATSCRT